MDINYIPNNCMEENCPKMNTLSTSYPNSVPNHYGVPYDSNQMTTSNPSMVNIDKRYYHNEDIYCEQESIQISYSSSSSSSSLSNDGSTDSAPETTNLRLPITEQPSQVKTLTNFEQKSQSMSSIKSMSSLPSSSSFSSSYNRSLIKQQHRQLNELTLQWLGQNYELRDGICLPRCLIYRHYLEFMQTVRPSSKPVGAAAFGKLVRQKFPKISTRRLGTRGQSKYHYYGISIRQSSPFFDDQTSIMYSQNHGGSPSTLLLQDLKYHQKPSTTYQHYHSHNNHGNMEYYHQNVYYNNQNLTTYLDPLQQQNPMSHSESVTFYSGQIQQQQFVDQFNYSESIPINYYDLPMNNSNQQPQTTMYSNIYLHYNQVSTAMKARCEQNQMHYQSQDTPVKRRNRTLWNINGHEDRHNIQSTNWFNSDQFNNEQRQKMSEEIEYELEQFCSSPPQTAFGYFQSNYPTVEDVSAPMEVSSQILSTFLLMYHSHCQRLFDTFQLANVDELRRSLLNFWQEMPSHLAPLMASPFIFKVIHLIDTLLYRTVEDFFAQLSLMPEMSETFVSDMKIILHNMNDWLSEALLGQSSRMREIIFQYRINKNTESKEYNMTQQNKTTIYNQIEEHLILLLKLKNKTFDDFSLGIQKQLKFIDMVKDCRKRINQSKSNYQMLIDMQSLSSWIEVNGSQSYPQIELLTSNIVDLVQIEMMKQESPEDNNNGNKFMITNERCSVLCRCPTPESMLQQVHQQFQLLIRFMQHSNNCNIVKILNWTKATVDRNVSKCNWKCMKRRSKILLYGINFYITNVMRDLTVNECQSLTIWNMVFLCIKEYLLLYLARVDRYETKLLAMRNDNKNNIKNEPVSSPFQNSLNEQYWHSSGLLHQSESQRIKQEDSSTMEHYEQINHHIPIYAASNGNIYTCLS